MTIKIPVTNENGVMSRKEKESECNEIEQIWDFVESNYGNLGELIETVCLKTTRNNIVIRRNQLFTISIDLCIVTSSDFKKSFMEIEIESLSNDCQTNIGLEDLQSFIIENIGFQRVNESKYSRALRWILSIKCVD